MGQAMSFQRGRIDQVAREKHPRGQYVLARTRKTNLPGLLVVQQRGASGRRADQVVTKKRRPQFATYHLRRLAAHVSKVQRLFDRPDVKLNIPTKTI